MTNERKEYLNGLAEDFGVDRYTVFTLASMLGENEDYDGLIVALEDYCFWSKSPLGLKLSGYQGIY